MSRDGTYCNAVTNADAVVVDGAKASAVESWACECARGEDDVVHPGIQRVMEDGKVVKPLGRVRVGVRVGVRVKVGVRVC
jgi:hypothetical protein